MATFESIAIYATTAIALITNNSYKARERDPIKVNQVWEIMPHTTKSESCIRVLTLLEFTATTYTCISIAIHSHNAEILVVNLKSLSE